MKNLMEIMMNKYMLVFLSLIFAASSSIAQENPLQQVEGAADLEKVKRAKFRETYVNTGVDFSKYNKLYLGDALFDYRDVGPAQRSRTYSSSKSVFGISEADRQKFEKYVDEAFMKEVVKGKKFKVVDTIDDNTIIMRGAVVDIVSRVPPEFAGRSEIYLASVGEATLVLEFIDGKSGEVLARIAERRALGRPGGGIDMMMPTSSVSVWADVRRWASGAARRLRGELDSAIDG